jgi:hypothetical protein
VTAARPVFEASASNRVIDISAVSSVGCGPRRFHQGEQAGTTVMASMNRMIASTFASEAL